MKKLIVLLLLCSVYFSYGQQRTTRTNQAIAIVNGEIIPMEQFNRMTLSDIGGVRAVHNGVSAEKRDSLIGVFGDILPPRELIIYIETGTVTEGESTPIVLRDVRGEQNEVLARQARASLFPFAPGDEVPDFTLNDVNGNPFMLSSLRGQYVLLNFWGTWCAPCIAGIPRMKEFYEKHQHNIDIVGVATRESSVENWQAEVERLELPWINVFNDSVSAIHEKYDIGGFPTKLLVSPDGTVLLRHVGGNIGDFYERVENIIEQ